MCIRDRGFINYNSSAFSRTIPLYLETRGYIADGKVSPYYSFAVGINFGVRSEDLDEDITINPGSILYPALGFKIGTTESAIMIDVGFKYANFEFESDGIVTNDDDRRFERFVLRLGVML